MRSGTPGSMGGPGWVRGPAVMSIRASPFVDGTGNRIDDGGHEMRVVISEFTSLDGVVQAPGGPDEDTSGGFRHGGWSMKYFDPDVMGALVDEFAERSGVLLQGRR